MYRWKPVLLLALGLVVGCGPGPQITGSAEEKGPREVVKTTLQQLAETGQMGSDIGAMMEALEAMKATDPALAEELLEDANQLMSARGPAAVKAKAKQMLDKLGGEAEPAP